MTKARKLKHFETINDLVIGDICVGTFKDGFVVLNENIKGRITKNIRQISGEVAVKAIKIAPPSTIEFELLEGEYEIIDPTRDIESFTLEDVGKKEKIYCKVEKIQQTSGPTLFTLFDGSASIIAKAFAGPGKRAFPDLKEGSTIKAYLLIKERDETIEADLEKFERLQDKREEQLLRKIQKKVEEKAKVDEINFLIKSDVLEKLKPAILNTAQLIKKSILEARPILIRHHNDCDGYSGAIALERAILSLIEKQHTDERARYKYYSRSPSKAPLYEYEDALKDLAFSLHDMSKFGVKEPLIIIADNGSTEQDLLAIKRIKTYNTKIIVIDHHYPGKIKEGKAAVDEFLDSHVNPHLVGGDNNISAGMLGAEIARFVNKNIDSSVLAALAGIADRCSGKEAEQYLELAKKQGYDKNSLKELAEVIDFEAYHIGFIESREIFEDILGNKEKQQQIIALLKPEIDRKVKQQLEVMKHFAEIDDLGTFIFAKIDIKKAIVLGEYPKAGKSVGILNDFLIEKNKKPAATIGINPDAVNIRASPELSHIDVNKFITELREKFPFALIDGGGHRNAGTIQFIESAKEEIVSYVEDMIKKA